MRSHLSTKPGGIFGGLTSSLALQSGTAFLEHRNRKRTRLPTACGNGSRKPSEIRNSAGKCSSSIVQLLADQAEAIFRIGCVALSNVPTLRREVRDRNSVAGGGPPASARPAQMLQASG